MNKEKFITLLDDFLDELKKDKTAFVTNLDNLPKLKDEDLKFIDWVNLYLKWSEVTTDMKHEYFSHWDYDEDA